MSLTFLDRHGHVGRIDETLAVTDTGADGTATAIEAHIEDLRTAGGLVDEPFSTLMIALIGEYEIHDIRQRADRSPERYPLSED